MALGMALGVGGEVPPGLLHAVCSGCSVHTVSRMLSISALPSTVKRAWRDVVTDVVTVVVTDVVRDVVTNVVTDVVGDTRLEAGLGDVRHVAVGVCHPFPEVSVGPGRIGPLPADPRGDVCELATAKRGR